MAAVRKSITVLETCLVSPPAHGPTAAEQILHLTYLDLPWLHFHPTQRLLFYQFPSSTAHFQENIVPGFTKSLALALKHFYPLAGNLIYPENSDRIPYIRYAPGDSVPVTVAEYNGQSSDFDYLTENYPRDADEFHAFFTDLSPPRTEPESGFLACPLFTAQITLFRDAGICLGFNNSHTAGDASSIVGFLKAWSLIARVGNDGVFFSEDRHPLLPVYDRSLVSDPSGRLLNILWNQMKDFRIEVLPENFPTNRVRATFILRREDIQKLRSMVQSNKPNLIHLSSFTITTAYVWSCFAKSAAEAGEAVGDDEVEYFGFAVDARLRTKPPIPAAYFGNCVGLVVTESTHSELKGEQGFLIAVELIGELIQKKVNKEDELLKDAEEWLARFGGIIGKRALGVAGSPRFDLYDADFGWGKPKKYEAVAIDGERSMSLCKSREFDGGLEIGLSMSKTNMEAFAAVFPSLLN
ncbi:malonyl-coenzyme:anthocyanin 5-O-glucoside-6'''-O-malonyltransferase-like [Andrographis paniculata]|uniref:malonyl-coenzyme:anthocyanin 5-O-glucoside-6'''-O-malonyltransferase-like n=1 Tax=Andrographis paniculata TaxID=175694 RepID=UPI0021E95886|nr:malonyl-coenzyme:anthocyanin 5-O-glucoside-6'''-O-malonyltransferase-like [Andrographis paniculata]